MSRSTATATDQSQTLDLESNEQTTRPLPTVTPFDLIAEARRLDALAAQRDEDADSTLMLGVEENRRLLASAFALGESRVGSRPAHDDEPTLAAPAPHLFLVQSLDLEVEPPPETLRMAIPIPAAAVPPGVVLPAAVPTPAAVPPPASGMRPRLTSERVRSGRQAHASEAPRRTARKASWLPRGSAETWVVVGIWAMALSLIAILLFMARGA